MPTRGREGSLYIRSGVVEFAASLHRAILDSTQHDAVVRLIALDGPQL
jgi:hypothetical protein